MKPVALFTATRWEYHALLRAVRLDPQERRAARRYSRGRHGDLCVSLVQHGVGTEVAARVARETLAAEPFSAAVSTGFGCALVPASVGDLLVATGLVMAASGEELDGRPGQHLTPSLGARALAVASGMRLTAHAGPLLTLPQIVTTAREKAAWARRSGAIALDMESAAIATAAGECGVPFAAIRAVSDLLDEDLPMNFNVFLQGRGRIRGVWRVLTRPSCWVPLHRLRRQSRTASGTLTRFFEAFLRNLATDGGW